MMAEVTIARGGTKMTIIIDEDVTIPAFPWNQDSRAKTKI